jgi:hypothetical protein
MNRLTRFALATSAAVAAALFFSAPARADVQQLDGGCEFKGGVDCTSTCTTDTFEVICDADLSVSCQGMCSGTATASCNTSCQSSCTGACTANPGMFTCSGECEGDCDAKCMGECQAHTDGATSQADCEGKCNASCKGRCEGSCNGTPPSATCDVKCQASCSGDCTAQANFACQVQCASNGFVSCQTNYKSTCNTKCNAQGVVVCNGVVQQFVDDVNAAKAWIAAHVTYSGEASGSCMGNTCMGQASGQVSSKCSAAPLGTDGGAGLALGGGVLAIAAAGIARRRRRS